MTVDLRKIAASDTVQRGAAAVVEENAVAGAIEKPCQLMMPWLVDWLTVRPLPEP